MRWLRVFMVWMLALALPVQGMAAAAMLHCGSAERHAPRQHAVADGSVHAAGHGEHHHPAGHGADHAHAGAPADEPGTTPHANAAGHACSACAACCVALALPPAMPVLAMADAAPTGVTVLVAPSPSFLTAGPERPPRSLHA